MAGYVSGVASIVLGNPLEIWKTRVQASASGVGSVLRAPALGSAFPVMAFGAVNAILFASYNTSLRYLPDFGCNQWTAGAIAGVCIFGISAPTELVRCRSQVTSIPSFRTAREIYKTMGLRGFYYGGTITVLRDAIGYGFYFLSYESTKTFFTNDTMQSLIGGGIAGCVTWATIYPIDVIKTQYTTQEQPLLASRFASSWDCARQMYSNNGIAVFFRGMGICMCRAFFVNAVQFYVFEWTLRHLHDPIVVVT